MVLALVPLNKPLAPATKKGIWYTRRTNLVTLCRIGLRIQ